MKRVTILANPEFIPAVKGGRTAKWNIVLNDEAPSSDVTVTITGSLTTNNGPFTFTSANWSIPQQVIVTAVDDGLEEGAVFDTLTISATGGGYSFNGSVRQRMTDDACDWRYLTPWPFFQSRHIQGGVALSTIRTELIAEVFNGSGLPTNAVPSASTIGYSGAMHQTSTGALVGAASTDRLVFPTVDRSGFNWYSVAYHIKRIGGATRLCFVHSGHGSEANHIGAINDLIAAGYDVMYMAMPIVLENTEDNPTVTGVGVTGHNSILSGGLDNGTWSPLGLFFGDKIQALNYLDANYSYSHCGISGCSGGGLTALWCAALDERFSVSINCRGTSLIQEIASAAADTDYEQGGWMNFISQQMFGGFSGTQVFNTYQIAPYIDLICLAQTNGRRHYAYHNLNDSIHKGNGQHIVLPAILGAAINFNFTQDDDVAYALHSFNIPDRALIVSAMNSL